MLFRYQVSLTNRQTEELAKLFMDIGKLIFASLVLGLFQINLNLFVIVGVSILGLLLSLGLFIIGLKLYKEVK